MKKAEEIYELKKKSPGAAAGASVLIVGLGQAYAGHWARGLIQIILCIALWFVLMGWLINIFSIVDAYQIVQRDNKLLRLELGLEA